MRLPVNHAIPLAALLFFGGTEGVCAQPATPSGPAADYPVIVGEPFTIGSTTWTPTDQLNYDAVGVATVGGEGLAGISGAHKTLPLPSYAEVTSLDSGRTILVRLVARGPMVNDVLLSLSPAAATQLGLPAGGRSAVRVRRVNPPEVERAALRTGGTAPLRMETPDSLLKVLRRKLAEQSPLAPPPSVPPKMPTSLAVAEPAKSTPSPKSTPAPKSAPALKSAPAPKASPSPAASTVLAQSAMPSPKAASRPETPAPAPTKAATRGSHVVQVAAFSTKERARKVAGQLGGEVSASGRLWRVRLGPFSGSGEAAPALEKARAAGYRDARIQRAD
ncbi:rare lipoprotein A [Novosphingobium chloroacetimidivorans]|uniref:Rare lipoprotein A n=1 Tax=Novosphingobium chloroacetimidivorans TaxID=1428314 RepID=A0A7W7K733_9SPHN|nr:SPOR domain-containing protein [Novosphingobium chloroacetimidivorans]MBB4856803.1 rare lipoprotein A [Novosphingobium chloroacetimidivorans]